MTKDQSQILGMLFGALAALFLWMMGPEFTFSIVKNIGITFLIGFGIAWIMTPSRNTGR